jgi:uncharacterized Zn-binding protein involved in type VI secretion
MEKPAAKKGDKVIAVDTHVVLIPTPAGPSPTPMPMPFDGVLDGGLSGDVFIDEQPAAMQDSTATNMPVHVPQGGPFQKPPSNRATIQMGSPSVFIDDRAAARMGDPAMTCNDPADAPVGKVMVVAGTVFVEG